MSKYNYSSLPAEQRLSMLRGGNRDLFEEELSRTNDVINQRAKSGLGIDSQLKWLNNVTSNYAASTSTQNKSANALAGALQKYYRQNAVDRKNYLKRQHDSYVDSVNKIYDKYKQAAITNYNKQLAPLRETLLNNGYSLSGGKTISEELKLKENLNNILSAYEQKRLDALTNAAATLQSNYLDIDDSVAKNLSSDADKYNDLLQLYYDKYYNSDNSKTSKKFDKDTGTKRTSEKDSAANLLSLIKNLSLPQSSKIKLAMSLGLSKDS